MKAEDMVTVDESGPLEEDVEMQDVENVPPRGKSLLLNLPPEILQLVLFHADTGALLASLTTCKRVYDAAKAKHVVLQHMNRMPGLRLGLADLDSKTLFDTFRQRAAKGLYAAGVSVVSFLSPFVLSTLWALFRITSSCRLERRKISTQICARSTNSQYLGFGPYYRICPQRRLH